MLCNVKPWISIILLAIFTQACTPKININVNSIAEPDLMGAKSYYLSSARDDVDENDLFFKEFRRYFDVSLQQQGYIHAKSLEQADIEVLFKYGVSAGRTGFDTFSIPIYDTVGGESITIPVTVTDAQGQSTTTYRTIHIPARIQRVGSSIETRSYTLFNRTVSLQAHLLKGNKKVLWFTNVSSVGESNDLRSIMPYLAAAAAPYLGKNSGQQISIELELDNPEVLKLRTQN